MDRATTESLTLRQPLPESWVARIFQTMQGHYGTRFLNMWKTGQTLIDGTDAGLKNAMAMWGEKLGGFSDQPDRIRRVLDALPEEPPSLPKFVDLCRAVRVESSGPALAHQPTPEERQRSREAAEAATKALKPKFSDGIDTHWATHPRSAMHLKFIFDAAKKDQRFAPCVAEMVNDGICTEDGHLLKFYRDQQFHRVTS